MIKELIFTCLSLTAVDGDTVKCDGENLRLLGNGVPFVTGIDTPEMGRRAKCQFEKNLAVIAKHRLSELLENDVRVISSGAKDHFDRPLVNIYLTDGSEVGKTLFDEGYAKTWHVGKKIDWCN